MPSARPLIDHDEIRKWAEARRARPACVKGTGARGDVGMIRLDLPGYSGGEHLAAISWDDWFSRFETRGLALIVQDTTADGTARRFNTLVSRDGVEANLATGAEGEDEEDADEEDEDEVDDEADDDEEDDDEDDDDEDDEDDEEDEDDEDAEEEDEDGEDEDGETVAADEDENERKGGGIGSGRGKKR